MWTFASHVEGFLYISRILWWEMSQLSDEAPQANPLTIHVCGGAGPDTAGCLQAMQIARYVTRGMQLSVSGKLKLNHYVDHTGGEKSELRVRTSQQSVDFHRGVRVIKANLC